MNAAISFLSSLALKLIGPILAYLKGRGDAELKQTKDSLKGMRDAKAIDDRIERDPAYRNSVRDEYK
jgi:hypothetical protein